MAPSGEQEARKGRAHLSHLGLLGELLRDGVAKLLVTALAESGTVGDYEG